MRQEARSIEAKHQNILSKQMQWHLLGLISRGMNEEARHNLETNIRSSDKSEWTIEAKLTCVTRGTTRQQQQTTTTLYSHFHYKVCQTY